MANECLRVAIVDDEAHAREGLRLRLAGLENVALVGEAASADEALEAGLGEAADVILLDIQMPGTDGLEAARKWLGASAKIIFVTAWSRHAVEAFDIEATDYLVKPVRTERLRRALERVRKARKQPANPILELMDGQTRHRVLIADIDHVEAAGDYMCVRTDDKTVVVRRTLSDLMSELVQYGFTRIHRSRAVNLDRVAEVEFSAHGGGVVRMRSGAELAFSKTYRRKLKARVSSP